MTGEFLGTVGYVPPESVSQDIPCNPNQDCWAFGLLILCTLIKKEHVDYCMHSHQVNGRTRGGDGGVY